MCVPGRWMPSLVIAPPTKHAFITPISTLSLVASRDPEVLEMLGLTAQEAVGSRTILSYVFRKFGYDEANIGMDLLTFDGATIARPVFTAFYGSNIQLAGLLSILSACLAPLLTQSPGSVRELLAQSPGSVTEPLQDLLMEELSIAIFDKLKTNQLVQPSTSYINTGNTSVIASIMTSTYDRVATVIGKSSVHDSQLTEFFQGVAQVSGRYGTA